MLTVHITASIGWIGAVIAYLVLVCAAMTSTNERLLTAVWMALYLMGYFAVVPMALASLLTGIIQSVATPWGLFKHYWVIISLGLTIFATIILLQHMQTVSFFAALAAETSDVNSSGLREALKGEVFHAGIGLLVLLVVQVINVYKPRGLTPYGWRKQQEQRKIFTP